MSSFEGKVIALTGGASGIGLATARILATRGAKLSIADIQAERLAEVATELKDKGASVIVRKVDVRNREEVENWIDDTIKEFGSLYGAGNLAGVMHSPRPIGEYTEDLWDSVIGVNLTGVMNSLRAEIPRIERNGAVVNAGSLASLQGISGAGPYVASKHGVLGLTRTVAKEVGNRGIRVNCFAP